jgi:hypothetical protein
MRKILSLFAVLALAACGGGGGGTTANAPAPPTSAPTLAPQGQLVTPQFTLVVPQKAASSGTRKPLYISASTLSVTITLNNPPVGLTNTSVTTQINGTSGNSCTTGCTVSGPPSPPGSDSFTVTTYDAPGGAGPGAHALSTATKTFVIVAGSANANLTITLNGIVAALAISGVPSATANTAVGNTQLTVTPKDAAGAAITGTYGDSTGAANPVTVSINETDANGATLVAAGSATQNTTTSVTLHSDADSVSFHYGGVAENTKTLTVAASGVTSATTTFQPTLLAITPASGTEVDLFVPGDVGGTGASGGQTFAELGFTNSPYSKSFSFTFTPTSTFTTPCANIATNVQSTPGVFAITAATVANSPTPGSCDLTVNDGLTQNLHTSTATVAVTYTTSAVHASGKHRRN